MSHTDAESVIELRGLRRHFGTCQALAGLDLNIPAGVTGLLGPNGAGKSTLVRILLGLDQPTAGSVRVLGHDPVREGLAVRRLTGYAPEGGALVPGLQGVEQVALAAELTGLSRRDALLRAHESLAFVGLQEARYRKVEEYSTGMRQRLKLALAVVGGPRLLVLDEPTNGLDPEGRREVLKTIETLAVSSGVSVVISSHVLRDVESICRWAVVLRDGRVVSEGPVQHHSSPGAGDSEAGGSGQQAWIVRLIKASSGFEERARSAAMLVESLDSGSAFRVELSADQAARSIFGWARESGVAVLECRPARTSLEATYLKAFYERPAEAAEEDLS